MVPETMTPTGAALCLSRFERDFSVKWTPEEMRELRDDIDSLQRAHFGADDSAERPIEESAIRPLVKQWAERLSKKSQV